MLNGQAERDVEEAAHALFDALIRLVHAQLDIIDDLLWRLEYARHPDDTD